MAKQPASKVRAERFKNNLRRLIETTNLTQAAFAARLKLSYPWLRKACSDGIARRHPDNEDHLKRICDFFGIEPDDLWAKRIALRQITATDEVNEEVEYYVKTLTRLMTDHPKNRNVAEIKRVIDEVTELLPDSREPTSKEVPSPPPPEKPVAFDGKRILDSLNAMKRSSGERKGARIAARTTPSREVRTHIDRKEGKSYEVDLDQLDDQIDGIVAENSDVEDAVSRRRRELDGELAVMEFEMAIGEPNPRAERLSHSIGEFIQGLPEPLKNLFDNGELRTLVSKGLLCGASEKKLKEFLEGIAEQRRQDDPELKVERKRIRRRIRRHKDG